MSSNQLDSTALLESLLFVASGPVPIGRLAKTLEMKPKQVESLLYELQEQYVVRGLSVQWTNDGVQLTSAPEAAGQIEQFLGLETTTRLSQAALEVMSIVAYMQPVTRPQIDRIRGVNSDGSLRKLLTFGLIEEVGRQDTPGRPILYGTTPAFLQQFGLSSLDDLPDLPSDEADEIDLSNLIDEIAGVGSSDADSAESDPSTDETTSDATVDAIVAEQSTNG